MILLSLQFFGGRGAGLDDGGTPGGGAGDGQQTWQGNVGKRVYADPAEALGRKGQAMSSERATLGANPNYNPAYSEYSENCQRCVVAYEARRRGYDVVAHATYEGDTMGTGENWLNNFVGAKREYITATTKPGMQQGVESQMSKWGNGSRAIVSVKWEGCSFGHVINVENKGGKTIYRDAQTGKKYEGKNFFSKVSGGSVTITRVDNLPFSDTVGQAVTKDKG